MKQKVKFYEFLDRKELIKDDSIITAIKNIEDNLTPENFKKSSKEVYRLVFNEEPDPIIFSGHKFFHTKIVKEPFTRVDLMEKGLHIFRMIFARYAHELRWLRFKPDSKESFYYELDEKGYTKIYPFITSDRELIGKVKNYIESFPVSENKQPFNSYRDIVKQDPESLIKAFVYTDSDLPGIITSCAHRYLYDDAAKNHYLDTTYVQRVDNVPQNGDIQKVCHSDVFYPCVKYWYFPEEVTEDKGSFWYAEGSNILTYELVNWYYQQSVDVVKNQWDPIRNKGHGEGSFRMLDHEIEELGLELKPIEVEPNTLVIADTSGFHRRGDTKTRFIRNAIHGACRVETPFDTYPYGQIDKHA